MVSLAGAREGDWKCGGCGNRNYAFRSICNRCKQARLLVDSQTPADSKWLPRIGDWICPGCSNNNYASREKCNKCSQPKAAGALAQAGIAVPSQVTPPMAMGLNMGMALPMSIPSALGMAWQWGGGGAITGGVPPGGNFRVGDWICSCGFHNYSSRLTCRQCQRPSESATANSAAAIPPTQNYSFSGKRMATDDAGGDWANKRLNMGGDFSSMHPQYFPQQQQQQFAYAGLNGRGNFYSGQPLLPGLNVGIPGGSLQVPNSLQLPPALQGPIRVLQPAILGKGAKQWRVGDWMCPGCSNHNFASRNSCNRCGRGKEGAEITGS